eukprot:8620183-Lingulodinium_polyedra.AAC.1
MPSVAPGMGKLISGGQTVAEASGAAPPHLPPGGSRPAGVQPSSVRSVETPSAGPPALRRPPTRAPWWRPVKQACASTGE